MSALRLRCPHCDGEIRADITLEAVATPRKGPKPGLLDPEVEKFIVEAIEVYRSTYRAVGDILEERGVLTTKGHKRWHPTSVKREYDKVVKRRVVKN